MKRRLIPAAILVSILLGASAAGAAVSSLSLGDSHSCALRTDGSVWCWGEREGQTLPAAIVPATVDGAGEATAVSAGATHTCAIRSSGAVVCWGASIGGDTHGLTTSPPASVNGTSGTATAIASQYGATCAIQATTGAVVCWGGEHQVPTLAGRLTPPNAVNGTSGGATAIAVGLYHACAIRSSDGGVTCWGSDYAAQATPPVSVATGALAIAAGSDSSCAITSAGAVVCWGGWSVSSPPPASVNGTSGTATAVWMFSGHACARQATSAALVCWGESPANPSRYTVPSSLNGTSGTASTAATGGYHTCAVQTVGGAVVCFGSNTYGQTTPPGGL